MRGKKKKKGKDNSTNINFSPFPIETGNDQPFQNIAPPQKQANTPAQGEEETKDSGSIQTPPGQNKWSIKKEISIGDILTTVIVVISIAAIFISLRTLVETQRQFKILNEPYLEITKPVLMFNDSAIEFYIIYNLENLKPYPAQIINKTQTIILDTSANLNSDSIFKAFKEDTSLSSNGKNIYVIKETPLPPFKAPLTQKNGLTLPHYNSARDRIYYIYFVNVVRYKDLISGKRRKYRCIVKMKNITNSTGNFYAEYDFNENKDEKED